MMDAQHENEFADLISSIESKWESIYASLQEDPSVADEYLVDVSFQDVGESLLTILVWMRSLRKTKKSSAKTRKLAKAALFSRATVLSNRLAKIDAGEYQQFPSLISDIALCLTQLSAFTILAAKKNDVLKGLVESDVANEVAELATKKEIIEDLESELTRLIDLADGIPDLEKSAKENCFTVNQVASSAVAASNIFEDKMHELDSLLKDINDANDFLQNAKADSIQIIKDLRILRADLNETNVVAKETRKKVLEMLPEATSAGLASSFDHRARTISTSVKAWVVGFVLGIVLLIMGIIGSVEYIPASKDSFDWLVLLRRLVFIAPGVWVAWYCARGISNVIKLRESYSYKAAISRAFEGYKNQMIELDEQYESSELAAMLSESVLAILASDPVAILDKPDEDGHTPWESIYNKISKRKKKRKGVTNESSNDIEDIDIDDEVE
ncbi:MAG: hypothetical protein AAGB26_12665 [Planctomycetota bacterium]